MGKEWPDMPVSFNALRGWINLSPPLASMAIQVLHPVWSSNEVSHPYAANMP